MAGYLEIKEHEPKLTIEDNHRIKVILDRLIQLCLKTNKPEEVKKWQAEIERLTKNEPVKK